MAEILVAEDDASVRKWLSVALQSEGYAVRVAADGEKTLSSIRAKRPDLIVLDVTMPKQSGLDVCRTLRAEGCKTPVLMLTARNKESDQLAGFGCGADDYMTKPFSMDILFARIAALLRRANDNATADKSFSVGSHRIDASGMSVIAPDGVRTDLAARECELLELLNRHRGEVLKRDWLLDRLWGVSFGGTTRTLDQHIALLRRKLGEDADRIETVRNVGYRLV